MKSSHQRITHGGDIGAGLLEFAFRFRRDGQCAHIDGLGELIDVLRQARAAQLTKNTAQGFGIRLRRYRFSLIDGILENGLDVATQRHIARQITQGGFFSKLRRSENGTSRFFLGDTAATALKSLSEMLIITPRIIVLVQGVDK